MLTVMIAMDEATEFNGCLYFLPGTHGDGRLNPYFDTSTAWKLWAVTPQDVKAYMKEKAQPVAITGMPGMVAIFHCNLLHASGHNLSPDDRTQAYFCFNRVSNRLFSWLPRRSELSVLVRCSRTRPIVVLSGALGSSLKAPSA